MEDHATCENILKEFHGQFCRASPKPPYRLFVNATTPRALASIPCSPIPGYFAMMVGKEIAGSDGPILCKFADNPTHRNGKGTGRSDRQHGQWIGSMGMPGAFGAVSVHLFPLAPLLVLNS